MVKYGQVVYTPDRRPLTSYPRKLMKYLFEEIYPVGRAVLRVDPVVYADLGCGRGDFITPMAELLGGRATIYGVDAELHPEMEELIQHSNTTTCLATVCFRQIVLDRQFLPFDTSSVDVVFTKSVIEHLTDWRWFLQEIHRILRPGGRLVIMTPDWHSQWRMFWDDPTHVHPFTVQGLKDALLMTDFEKVYVRKFYQLPVLWRAPWLTIVSELLQLLIRPDVRIRNRFIRWSVELMLLGTAVKGE